MWSEKKSHSLINLQRMWSFHHPSTLFIEIILSPREVLTLLFNGPKRRQSNQRGVLCFLFVCGEYTEWLNWWMKDSRNKAEKAIFVINIKWMKNIVNPYGEGRVSEIEREKGTTTKKKENWEIKEEIHTVSMKVRKHHWKNRMNSRCGGGCHSMCKGIFNNFLLWDWMK